MLKINDGEITDVICNKCGNSLNIPDGPYPNYEGLTEVAITGGYYSNEDIIGDCKEVSFSLCEKCLGDLFETFKHPPLFIQRELNECMRKPQMTHIRSKLDGEDFEDLEEQGKIFFPFESPEALDKCLNHPEAGPPLAEFLKQIAEEDIQKTELPQVEPEIISAIFDEEE